MPGGPLVVGGDDNIPQAPPTLVTPGVTSQFDNPQFPSAPAAASLPPPQSPRPVPVVPSQVPPPSPQQPAPTQQQPVFVPPPPPQPGALVAGQATQPVKQKKSFWQTAQSAAPQFHETVRQWAPPMQYQQPVQQQQYEQPPQQSRGSSIRAGAIGFSVLSGLFPIPFNPLFFPIQMTVFIIMIIVLLFKGWDFWTAALLSWLIPGLIAAVMHYMFLGGLLSMVGMGEEGVSN